MPMDSSAPKAQAPQPAAFYAITAERLYQHPLIAAALARDERELLEGRPRRPRSRGARE